MRLKRDGLNIVPFIDVMLVLLAIVLSVSTFIAQGKIKIEVPPASSTSMSDDDKKVRLSIDAQNVIYYNDEQCDIATLKDRIKKVDSKTLIELRSDSNSKFETFVNVIDILKEKGHENFAIATKKQ